MLSSLLWCSKRRCLGTDFVFLTEQFELQGIGVLLDLVIRDWIEKMVAEGSALVYAACSRGCSDCVVLVSDVAFGVDEFVVPLLNTMVFIVIINRWIQWIQHNLEQLINHLWDKLLRPLVRLPQIWVGIDLYQPHAKVLVDHEVVTEQLKSVLSVIRVDGVLDSQESVDDDILHSGNQVLPYINFYIRPTHVHFSLPAKFLAIQILLESIITQRIPFFVLAVRILVLHLQTLVSQMYSQILAVQRILIA